MQMAVGLIINEFINVSTSPTVQVARISASSSRVVVTTHKERTHEHATGNKLIHTRTDLTGRLFDSQKSRSLWLQLHAVSIIHQP